MASKPVDGSLCTSILLKFVVLMIRNRLVGLRRLVICRQHRCSGTTDRCYRGSIPFARIATFHNLRQVSCGGFRRCFQTTTISPIPSQQAVLYDSLSDSFKSVLSSPSKSNNHDSYDSQGRQQTIWYTCGPTTYAPAHLGHARTYVCLDIIRRILEAESRDDKFLFVMNITDVDDKILAAAEESNEHPTSLARRFEADFWKDLDRLGCKRPHVVTRVTEYVESDIVPYIEKLVETGVGYVSRDGVYFDVRAFEEHMGMLTKYGKLAPPAASTDFFNSNNDDATRTSTTKRDVRDFVLWKFQKEDEALSWPSPWGKGRPGWHIECSAMIEATQRSFGAHVGFHAGGVDLKFPHHTNEIAQAEAYLSKPDWIPHWIHTGHLHIDGLKMSKSLKNFITIEEFFDGQEAQASSSLSSPADDFRLWCLGLSGSYRGTATFSEDSIREASMLREKLVKFLVEGSRWVRRTTTLAENEVDTKKWNDRDVEFHRLIEEASDEAVRALYGNNREGTPSFDLDGNAFVKQIVGMAEDGMRYIRDHKAKQQPAVEPLQIALSKFRDLLELVGFSDRTVQAGSISDVDDATSNQIVGGESRLAEEVMRFRSAVRKEAITGLKENDGIDSLKSILELCDKVRDESFPSIGLELTDGKIVEDANDDGHVSPPDPDSWRFCLPREASQGSAEDIEDISPVSNVQGIPVADFFKVGKYQGHFSEFDDNGLPLTSADGTEVSSRQRKKLMKKLEKHKRRLEQHCDK